MLRHLMPALLVCVGVCAVPRSASATNYTVTFCFRYGNLGYYDSTGGDYFESTTATAIGIRARVQRNSDLVDIYYDYTTLGGCTSALTLSNTQNYRVAVYSEAKLTNTNYVRVRNNDTDDQRYYSNLATAYVPTGNGQVTYTWGNLSDNVVQVAAAGGFAVDKRYGGLSNNTFTIYNQPLNGEEGVSGTKANGDVYLATGGKDRKFIIAHELGHAVGNRKAGDEPSLSYLATTGQCDEWGATQHDFASNEYQTAGATEGFAHFYAATVFNNTGESNCEFYYYKDVDYYPRDGSEDASQVYSCETGWTDFLHTYCTDYLTDRSIESDWLLFWWDMHTDHDLTFGTIADIWAGADTPHWTAASVYTDLRGAASAEGVNMTDWDIEADYNGVTE